MDSRFPSSSAGLYTELNQLNDLRRKASSDEQAALKEVAQQFEQIFISMMLKSMRDANDVFAQDNPFNSQNTRFFQDMHDQQLGMELSRTGSFGLAEVLVRQLSQTPAAALKPSGDEEKTQNLSDAEVMLSRMLDSTGSLAASAVLGRAHTLNAATSPTPEEAPDEAVEAISALQAKDEAPLPSRFNSPDEFVSALLPLAEEVAGELGVDPKVLLAQAALETGWGRFIIEGSHNLFNIKADSRWGGERVSVSTLEYRNGVAQREMASFRAYSDYRESFRDYVEFLRNNPRYSQALQHTGNPSVYLRELQAAGYATDPAYAQKIERIFTGTILARAGGSESQEG